MPENHGGAPDLLVRVSRMEIIDVSQQCINEAVNNDYQEYFEYARECLGVSKPNTWQAALDLFKKLIDLAKNGNAE